MKRNEKKNKIRKKNEERGKLMDKLDEKNGHQKGKSAR